MEPVRKTKPALKVIQGGKAEPPKPIVTLRSLETSETPEKSLTAEEIEALRTLADENRH